MKRDSILRNTGFAFIVKLGGAAMTAGLSLFLIRYLGPEVYGVMTLALSIGGLVLIPSDLGISQATARFIAESGLDNRLIAAVIGDGIRLKLIVSCLISAVIVVAAEPIAGFYDAPEVAWPLRIVAISILVESLFLFLEASFQALGRISAFLNVVWLKSLSEVGLSVGIVLLGGGAAGALAGRAAAYAFAAGYGIAVLARLLRPSRIRMFGRVGGGGYLKRILGYGSALLVVDGAFALFARIDTVLIGRILSIEDVGLYSAPYFLLATFGIFGMSVSSGVAPRMSRTPGEPPDPGILSRAIKMLIVLQGLAVAPLLVWSGPIADRLLGAEYEASATVLQAFAPYAFMMGISPLLAMSVNYLGEARRRIPIAFAALILNAAIDLAFLPQIGVVAAAIGTDVAYGVYLMAHLLLLRSLIGLRLLPLLSTLLRTAVAVLAMAATLLAFNAFEPTLLTLILGAAVAVAFYTMALVATGAVSRSELNEIRSRLGPLKRR